MFFFLKFLTCVVRFDGLGGDGAGGITFLEVLALGGDRPRHVAGGESDE